MMSSCLHGNGRSYQDLRQAGIGQDGDCEIRVTAEAESGSRTPVAFANSNKTDSSAAAGAGAGGLIRRAFSSKRRKKRPSNATADILLTTGDFLALPLRDCSRSHSSEYLSPFYLSPDDTG